MNFYAVARGRKVGIFNTWTECKLNTDGYNGSIFKKFDTRHEAEKFIEANKVNVEILGSTKIEGINSGCPNAIDILMKSKGIPKTKGVITEIEDSTFIPDYYVYTDGSCSNNGKQNAIAGIGIYFGENDSRNVSQLIDGKQTNNTAELTAILHLYTIVKDDILSGKKIAIVSDSEYAIRCVTTYGKKCEDEGWEKDIPNKELVMKLYQLYKNKTNVKFLHIMAHTDKTDIHSIGNDGADKLANNALGLSECPYKDKKGFERGAEKEKLYLAVPFVKKESIKQMGGRWDANKKLWYIYNDSKNKDEVLGLFKVVV
jgi:ribonuclease HI